MCVWRQQPTAEGCSDFSWAPFAQLFAQLFARLFAHFSQSHKAGAGWAVSSVTLQQLCALLGVAALVWHATIETGKVAGSLKLINASSFLSCKQQQKLVWPFLGLPSEDRKVTAPPEAMDAEAGCFLLGRGPKPDSIQPWAQQGWGWGKPLSISDGLVTPLMQGDKQQYSTLEACCSLYLFPCFPSVFTLQIQALFCCCLFLFFFFFLVVLSSVAVSDCVKQMNKKNPDSFWEGDGSCLISPLGSPLQTSLILNPVSLGQKESHSSFRSTKVL